MQITLRIWRQKNASTSGGFEEYHRPEVSEDMSFLEMLDELNEDLMMQDKEPVAFDHDCREGICGACGVTVNGTAHGPKKATTTCQLHMRSFKDGDTVTVEPWLAEAFPIVKDLVVDRSAFDRIIQSGGYISVPTGTAPDAHAIPISKPIAEEAMDAASCIGCGACVAACPNGAAMLFTAAKVSHLNILPQGQPERNSRVTAMVETMDSEFFGNCSNYGECEAVCPKEIDLRFIARMNRDYLRATLQCANGR